MVGQGLSAQFFKRQKKLAVLATAIQWLVSKSFKGDAQVNMCRRYLDQVKGLNINLMNETDKFRMRQANRKYSFVSRYSRCTILSPFFLIYDFSGI